MSVTYNYTKAKKREKRLYNLFNTTVSQSGISYNIIGLSFLCLVIFNIFGILFCKITNTNWYNPALIAQNSNVGYFYMFFILLPILLGIFLNTYKIQNYRVIDYIKLYFEPKPPRDQHGKVVKIHSYKIDSFIEKI